MNMCSYKCCSPDTLANERILAQSSLLKLLAEPSRLRLLCILKSDSHCVCDLEDHLPMSQSLISHHLSDLKQAGIVDDEKVGRQVRYSLTKKGQQVVALITSLASMEVS